MEVIADTIIARPRETVWQAITDIDNCRDMISSIIRIDVLNRPGEGLVGFKWQETREMFGKEATETMWVTDAVENEYYATRAESHGSVYLTTLRIEEEDAQVRLTMTFTGIPQTTVARILSFLMAPIIKSSLTKALQKDLQDIKKFLERN